MSNTIIRVGGVPEHFNMPWHEAIEQGKFREKGLEVRWTDFPGGTGAMNKALRENEIDVAVILTEGFIADVIKGNPASILGFYVVSPLRWGIHVPAKSDIKEVEDIKDRVYAISRPGSGSHLMAFVDADKRKWDASALTFKEVGNLNGAREALKTGAAEVFFWEKFTTKPYVDNGEFRIVGERPTPWPCFVLAARNAFIEDKLEEIRSLLSVLREQCKVFMQDSDNVSKIAKRYSLRKEDVETWIAGTEWATGPQVSLNTLSEVMKTLKKLQVVEEVVPPEQLCSVACRMV
ncbi:substrate-binding domain-containing protein [Cytophagaceae bacterium ABcell3]|nr:substrate-binding domain-containing protein [Cytophagaceae bacterium ABcell3]